MFNRSLAIAAVLSLTLVGCSSAPSSRRGGSNNAVWTGTQQPASATAEQVTLMALAMIGTPYRFGGNALGGFDCSGLSSYVYAQSAAVQLPRSAAKQADMGGKSLKASQLRSGDLLFFETVPGLISHVAIYVGEGRFVHAPSAGSSVRMDRLDNVYWQPRFRFGKRVAAGTL